MPPRAVLLDFDGVIVDSENYHVAAWQRTLVAMGRDAPDSLCAKAAEIDDHAFLSEIFGDRITSVDVEGWLGRKEAITSQMLADSPRLYEGARDLILKIASMGVLVGIVSTTKRENIETVLKAADLERAVTLIVGKQESDALKPDPAPYLSALQRLGFSAADAVALEDSEIGYKSATGGGLRTVVVGHRRATGPWHGDSKYLPNFRKTDEALETIGLSPEN